MKRIVLLLPLLALACARPIPAPVVVKVPVPVSCPPPIIPARPALPSVRLEASPSLESLLKALLADREALAAWALDLEQRLRAYLEPAPKENP